MRWKVSGVLSSWAGIGGKKNQWPSNTYMFSKWSDKAFSDMRALDTVIGHGVMVRSCWYLRVPWPPERGDQDGGQEFKGPEVREIQPCLWKRRKKKEVGPPSNKKAGAQKVKQKAVFQCKVKLGPQIGTQIWWFPSVLSEWVSVRACPSQSFGVLHFENRT